MGSRFDFGSPGAAFTDEMTRVLAERKAEERQTMLDNLTKAAELRATEAAAQDKMFREYQMQSGRARDEREQLQTVETGMDLGTDVSTYSPEIQALLQKYGRIQPGKPAGTPMVSTDSSFMEPQSGETGAIDTVASAVDQGPPVPQMRYVGTPEQRERERQRGEMGQVMSTMMASGDPEAQQVAGLMAQMVAAGQQPPPQMWNKFLPKNPIREYNEATGGMRTLMGPDGKPYTSEGETIIQRSRPPRVPASDYRPDPIGTDANGHPVFLMPNGQRFTDTSIQMKPDPNSAPLGIPLGMFNELNELSGLVREGAEPTDISQYRRYASSVISKTTMSPRVKELARIYLKNPAVAMGMERTVGLNEKELSDLRQLQDVIASPDMVPVLQAHAINIAMPKPASGKMEPMPSHKREEAPKSKEEIRQEGYDRLFRK